MATAKDLMSDTVRGVHESASLREVVALLAHHNLSGLPVIDSAGALKGVVSQYDALAAFSDTSLFDQPVTQHMSPQSITVELSTPIEQIAEMFREQHIQRAPVVDGPKVVGMVSRTDLVQYLSQFV